jgi:ubiquinone/menaquinone biosynthesis C-methylase UbiE
METAMISEEVLIQRERYANIANEYDQWHIDPEHRVGLSFLHGMLGSVRAESILDVGAGTGRAMVFLRGVCPDLRIMGVGP